MIPPAWRILAAYLWRRPWQGALAVMGIMLGVAVVMAVQVVQTSARRAFEETEASLAGAATDRLVATTGELPETLFANLCLREPALAASPVVTGSLATSAGQWLRLQGVDPVSAAGRVLEARVGNTALPALLLTQPVGLVSPRTLRALALHEGEALPLGVAGQTLRLHAVPATATGLSLPDEMVVLDIALAQDLLGAEGRLSYIDLTLPRTAAGAALRKRVQHLLAPDQELRDLRQDTHSRRDLSRAFETNLTALGMLSLLVGLFLAYNTLSFLVIQRHALFGHLRALGMRRREIFSAVLVESALLGALAGAAGVVLGLALAKTSLGLIAPTLSRFYAARPEIPTRPSLELVVAVWSLAILTSLLAAALPAWRAAGLGQRAALMPAPLAATWRRAFKISTACLALAGLLHWAKPGTLGVSFLVLSLGLLGGGALCLPLLRTLGQWTARAASAPGAWPERLGAAHLARADNRAGVATAALALAAAVSLGMQIMTASFRDSVAHWLDNLLRADGYVAAPAQLPVGPAEDFLARLRPRLADYSGLDAISSVLRRERSSAWGWVPVTAYELPARARRGFDFLAGDQEAVWAAWEDQDVVIVSEPLARRRRLAPGDSLVLTTRSGPREFRVVGIYRDYASERGTVALSRATSDRHWPETGYSGLGVYLATAAHWQALQTALPVLADPDAPPELHRREDVLASSLAIFDRTFAITRVLGMLALLVSLVGVVGALLAQLLERAREFSVLRALGCGRAALARVLLCQTLVLGVVAALAALPLGAGLSLYLVRVVNLHAFGWTMEMSYPASLFATTAASVLAAATVAAIYPARRLARIAPAHALREE